MRNSNNLKSDSINIARGLIRNKNYREAEELLIDALDKNPGDAVVIGIIADLYIKLERPAEAEKYIEILLKSEPGNRYALEKKGDILAMKKKYREAMDIFLDVLKHNTADYFLLKRISKLYYLMNNVEKAEDFASRAIELAPDKADIFYLLYQILLKDNKIEKAGKAIDRAIAVDPDNKFYYSQKLSLRMKEKNLGSGNIEEIIEMSDENNPHMIKLLISKLKEEGNFDKAVTEYKKLLSIENSEFNKKGLAFLYYKSNNYDKAFDSFMDIADAGMAENVVINTVMRCATTVQQKTMLVKKLEGITSSSDNYKHLWGKIKKLNSEIKSANDNDTGVNTANEKD